LISSQVPVDLNFNSPFKFIIPKRSMDVIYLLLSIINVVSYNYNYSAVFACSIMVKVFSVNSNYLSIYIFRSVRVMDAGSIRYL